jgi:glycine/D-amino acid oxidase-like deaminating enzyme
MADFVTVLGAGYTGLTTAAELALRGHRVRVIAKVVSGKTLFFLLVSFFGF